MVSSHCCDGNFISGLAFGVSSKRRNRRCVGGSAMGENASPAVEKTSDGCRATAGKMGYTIGLWCATEFASVRVEHGPTCPVRPTRSRNSWIARVLRSTGNRFVRL